VKEKLTNFYANLGIWFGFLFNLPYGDKIVHAIFGVVGLSAIPLFGANIVGIYIWTLFIGYGWEIVWAYALGKPITHLDAWATSGGGLVWGLLALALGWTVVGPEIEWFISLF
jgi:hypothetical protein